MLKIADRIKKVRDKEEMSQQEFSSKINVGRSTLANFELGEREPKEIHIKAICREFNVNEEWLRDGTGEMFRHLEYDDYTRAVTEIDINDPDARQAILLYWRLNDEDKKVFWNIAKNFIKNFNIDLE